MKKTGAAIVGFLCLAVAAVRAADAAQDLIVNFILIDGGKFMMGADNVTRNAVPIHEVAVKAFDISDTLVTVEQYSGCVLEGKCKAPETGGQCNWGKKDRQRHPINCVSWEDANDFAKFVGAGARLPSEAEYEYAATSQGKKRPYPWGESKATCDKAVMYGKDVKTGKAASGCGSDSTMPVCSKPQGNTQQGLCDMVGNVWQWMGDTWHDSYAGAPTDGSAWQDAGSNRVVRGGSFKFRFAAYLRADHRGFYVPENRGAGIGFRLARSRH